MNTWPVRILFIKIYCISLFVAMLLNSFQIFQIDFRTEEELQKLEDQRTRGPNAEIREHARKRALELKCAEMEDVMREQG